MSNTASLPQSGFSSSAPDKSNIRWFVCFLLFLATTINYMDRNVFGYIEPLLHNAPFMGWDHLADKFHQPVFDNNFGNVLIYFQIAYGFGFLFAGRMIDKLGTKTGYALAILIWACASISHSLVASVAGFCVARVILGLGESGNFPAAIKAVTEWFPSDERALANGLFNSGTNASFFIAPILIAAVTAKWGWHAAFICTGSMGLVWCVIWLVFPYNKLRRGATLTQAALEPVTKGGPIYSILVRHRGFWAFCIAKGLTDPIWWFYLFYLPKFLNDNYGLDLNHVKYPLIVIYTAATVGSIAGGWLSGFRMKHGSTVNAGRKFALLVTALCVLPIMLVPHMHVLSPNNAWPAIGLFCLATAAHQGWSANIFATPTDMFPSTSVSTVVGLGGAAGALGGAVFTWIVSHLFSLHPLIIFTLAAFAYVVSLVIFQALVPRLGAPQASEQAA